jgi:hypothetical protein
MFAGAQLPRAPVLPCLNARPRAAVRRASRQSPPQKKSRKSEWAGLTRSNAEQLLFAFRSNPVNPVYMAFMIGVHRRLMLVFDFRGDWQRAAMSKDGKIQWLDKPGSR